MSSLWQTVATCKQGVRRAVSRRCTALSLQKELCTMARWRSKQCKYCILRNVLRNVASKCFQCLQYSHLGRGCVKVGCCCLPLVRTVTNTGRNTVRLGSLLPLYDCYDSVSHREPGLFVQIQPHKSGLRPTDGWYGISKARNGLLASRIGGIMITAGCSSASLHPKGGRWAESVRSELGAVAPCRRQRAWRISQAHLPPQPPSCRGRLVLAPQGRLQRRLDGCRGPAAYLAPGGGLSACLSSGPGGSPAALQAVRKADRRPCRGLGWIEGLKAAVL